jgi:Cleft lip and palate transmembrane protein 1 (CLPTM1)
MAKKATNPKVIKTMKIENNEYYPIFGLNNFWNLKYYSGNTRSSLIPVNGTLESLDLQLSFGHIAFWKYQMYMQFEESFKTQIDMLGGDDKEIDQMKSMFMDTNPILLAVTMIVSLLHSVFDFLAFKNDIDFWKNKKNMEGLSFRTIILNVIQQLIIFLYLMDNDTSTMILVSTGIGLLIEIWKINKTVIVEVLLFNKAIIELSFRQVHRPRSSFKVGC